MSEVYSLLREDVPARLAEGSCSKCSKTEALCRYSKNFGNWYTDQQDDGNGGRVAQLGEHLLCKQGVAGSIPVTSTN
jgi:hypothetical protein